MILNKKNLNDLVSSIEAVECGDNNTLLNFKNGALGLCKSFEELINIDFSKTTDIQEEVIAYFDSAYHEIKFVAHGIYLENIEKQNQHQGVIKC